MTPAAAGGRAGPANAPAVFRVGLSGGIATGKSVVGEVFRQEGAFVLDADAVAHDLMAPETESFGEIRRAFGDGILDGHGAIDRRRLGSLVFRDPEARLRLNAILHPRILTEEQRRVSEYARSFPGGIAVTQAALLVETGIHRRYDRLVVTDCPPEAQVRRLRERDGISAEEATARLLSQGDRQIKLDAADHVIDTSGTLETTRRRAREVFAELRREWDARRRTD